MGTRTTSSIVLGCVLIFAAPAPSQNPPVNPHAELITEFETKIKDYEKKRKEWTKDVPKMKPTPSPEAIKDYQAELAAHIIKNRAGAKQGEFFTPVITKEFRHLIQTSLTGSSSSEIRSSLKTLEPVKVDLKVNQSFAPFVLQATPPTLLLNLVRLPQGLDYRLANGYLVLRDVDANLILDYIPNAVPQR